MPKQSTQTHSRPRCVFATVFWGEWHRSAFLDVNLPTMFAPGNLPGLLTAVDCEYLIYTTAQDAKQVISHHALRQLCSLMPVSFKLFSPSRSKHPIELHQEIWTKSTARARRQKAFMLFIPPDVLWANGSFAALRAALEGGKRAIFMTYPRVVSETILPAIAERYPPDAHASVAISAKDLMALAVTHIHPLMVAYNRSAAHFPIHPEHVLWPIEGDGFLLRLLARELFCFDPNNCALNERSLLARLPPEREIHIFRDSREFLGLSLTPLWKDLEWYLRAERLDPLYVGKWWTIFDSPSNDYISTFDLRFSCGGGDEAHWRHAAQQADHLLAHLRSAREFVRVLETLRDVGHLRAAGFLAAALRRQGLARRWPHRGPFLVLAPSDDAFARAKFNRVPGDGISPSQVRKMIEAHVVPMPALEELENDRVVRALDGHAIRLQDTSCLVRSGPHAILSVEQLRGPFALNQAYTPCN